MKLSVHRAEQKKPPAILGNTNARSPKVGEENLCHKKWRRGIWNLGFHCLSPILSHPSNTMRNGVTDGIRIQKKCSCLRSSKMRLHVFRSFHRLRAYMVRRVFKKRKIGSSMREAIGSFRSKRYARF